MDIAQIHETFLECGSKVVTDSRKIEPGCLFIALKGENFDGNDFAASALEKGAARCLIDRNSKIAGDIMAGKCPAKTASECIIVDDTLKTLRNLATYHRENTLNEGRRIRMLAITGTNGKTTTKELVRSVLASKYNVLATSGNLNNNIGVPLTLLGLTPETDLAIVEMGASHPGDIKQLVDIAHPDYGLVTNVGRAHLLGFGNFEGVKATKGELYDYVTSAGGKCFVNVALPDLVDMVSERPGMKIVPYGRDVQKARLLPQDAEHPFLRVSLAEGNSERVINTSLVGSYNLDNVLAALAVGAYFGVGPEEAACAIEAYVPSNGRSQMQRTQRNLLILDTYNANPSSMAAALDNFARFEAAEKAVFLGDMLELGADSDAEHIKILRIVHDVLRPEKVFLVGENFTRAARQSGYDYACFPTSQDASAYLAGHSLEGYAVLVKGSRGTRMENVVPQL